MHPPHGSCVMNKLSSLARHREEIIAMYEAGASTLRLARQYGVNQGYVAAFLHGAGITLRAAGRHAPEGRDERIHELHRRGFSLAEIARQAGLTRQRVHQLLKRATSS